MDRLIFDGKIKYNTEKILKSIADTNQKLTVKSYYTFDDDGNTILIDYGGKLNEFISTFKKSPSLLKIDELNKMIDNIDEALVVIKFDGSKKDLNIMLNSKELSYALQKVINIVNNNNNKLTSQGKGLKILTPKQCYLAYQYF